MIFRFKLSYCTFVCGILSLGFSSQVLAAPAAPKLVNASQLKQTSVTYERRSVRIYCLSSLPGTASRSGSKMKFTSFDYLASKTSVTQNRSTYNRYRSLSSLGKTQCRKTTTTPPRATPTPSPTPTPAPTGNFDNNGNVTSAGKSLFGIPSNLSANISTGRGVYNSYCAGCHVERTGRTFSNIRTSIARSPMLYDSNDLPDSQLAHLIAYLNRFRP